ncbi:hypothetical protein BKA65DRAFT_63347 [Rhexocercosporidium sp. MPI-PUGE-AT-0058]|nr:hypothetical protein BKA65DRAFT_63347 [Rhexocercosporidium sp. MPI-PUGE-AT-0058]
MSTQPSIPPSPPPGKDPPPSSSSALHSVTNRDNESRDTSPSTKPGSRTTIEIGTKHPSSEPTRKASLSAEANTKAMPPPPIPSSKPRPTITTHHSSSTNIKMNNPSFSSSHTQSTSQNTALQDQDQPEADPDPEREIQRPPFTPFFTLINDLSGGEQSTYHPAQVHYIFADDDVSEVLTEKLVRAMDRDGDVEGEEDDVGEYEEGGEGEGEEGEGETSSSSSATFRRDGTRIRGKDRTKDKQRVKDRKTAAREERVVIVDVNETGDAVTSVSSLSPSWQVLSAEIGKAPTWDKEGDGGENERGEVPGGLMLKIEGVGLDFAEPGAGAGGGAGVGLGVGGTGVKGKGKEREGDAGIGSANASGSGMGEEEMQALMEGFDRKMGMLRRIVQRGSRESLVGGEKS